ncbi:hypothetical protein ACFE04_009908 [Oxalis oulophora]
MAEALTQAPPTARATPELSVKTQRLEELAIKQSRQFIPVTPSIAKGSSLSLFDKANPKTKGFIDAREVLLRGGSWRVGDGGKMSILDDKWQPRQWDVSLIKLLFQEAQCNVILSIPLCDGLVYDQFIWDGNSNGVYTVKSGYYVAHDILYTNMLSTYMHVISCAFYYVVVTNPQVEKTWIYAMMGSQFFREGLWSRYIACLYYAVTTITTIGYGDIHPVNHRERLFNLIYAISFWVSIGYVLQRSYSLFSHDGDRSKKKMALEIFVNQNNISDSVRTEVLDQFDLELLEEPSWTDFKKIADCIPTSLKVKISKEDFDRSARTIYLFNDISDTSLDNIAIKTEIRYFNPGEYLIIRNESPNFLFLLLQGQVELMDVKAASNEQENNVRLNACCGALGVLFNENQPYTIRARSNSMVLRLGANDFGDSIRHTTRDYVILYHNIFRNLNTYTSGDLYNYVTQKENSIVDGTLPLQFKLIIAARVGNFDLMTKLVDAGENHLESSEHNQTMLVSYFALTFSFVSVYC